MNVNTYRIGVEIVIFPPYIVEVHAKTLIAEKIATIIDRIPNRPASNVEMPATNMWWPHVRNPTRAMPMVANTIAPYQAGFLCDIVDTTSLTTPMPGRTMM